VPFCAGELKIIGYNQDQPVSCQTINTANSRKCVHIACESDTVDQYKQLVIQLTDEQGYPVCHTEEQISFELEGDLVWIGADNGSIQNLERHTNRWITTRYGRALAIVHLQPGQSGAIQVTCSDGTSQHLALAASPV
jgi:hypothetical protein